MIIITPDAHESVHVLGGKVFSILVCAYCEAIHTYAYVNINAYPLPTKQLLPQIKHERKILIEAV